MWKELDLRRHIYYIVLCVMVQRMVLVRIEVRLRPVDVEAVLPSTLTLEPVLPPSSPRMELRSMPLIADEAEAVLPSTLTFVPVEPPSSPRIDEMSKEPDEETVPPLTFGRRLFRLSRKSKSSHVAESPLPPRFDIPL